MERGDSLSGIKVGTAVLGGDHKVIKGKNWAHCGKRRMVHSQPLPCYMRIKLDPRSDFFYNNDSYSLWTNSLSFRSASPVLCLSQGDRNFSALNEVKHNHLDNFNIPT